MPVSGLVRTCVACLLCAVICEALGGNATGSPQGVRGALVRRLSIGDESKQAILDRHNELRAGVTAPCTAADMEEMVWDASLAASAEIYAAQCHWGHDIEGNHANNWGENIAMQWNSFHDLSYGTELLVGMVQDWYDEIQDVEWVGDHVSSKLYEDTTKCASPDGNTGKCMIGHYTQVVWASTTHVGCGVAACDQGLGGDGGVFLVCKYSPPGNVIGGNGMPPPYTVGAPCAACSGSCANNLCSLGSTARCSDEISLTNMVFNDVKYTDCGSLMSATEEFGQNFWCDQEEPKSQLCELACGKCQVPNGLGMDFCGQPISKAALPLARSATAAGLATPSGRLTLQVAWALGAATCLVAGAAASLGVRKALTTWQQGARGEASSLRLLAADVGESAPLCWPEGAQDASDVA